MSDLKQLGWFRFYRSTQFNKIWKHDPTAWRVFEALMLLCNRHNGVWEGGRFQLSKFCSLKPTTTYQALKRLEKEKMVTLTSNNKYTIIYISKWIEYQSGDDTSERQQDDNRMTTKRQQNDTLTISKKKELRSKKDMSFLFELIQIVNPKEKPTPERQRALNGRLENYTNQEVLEAAVKFSKSDWHRKNGEMSIDNLLAPSKFGRWHASEIKQQKPTIIITEEE